MGLFYSVVHFISAEVAQTGMDFIALSVPRSGQSVGRYLVGSY